MNDIRLPIGLMFSALGLLLSLFGILSSGNTEMYRKSMGININLFSGLLMLLFGLLMLMGAYAARKERMK